MKKVFRKTLGYLLSAVLLLSTVNVPAMAMEIGDGYAIEEAALEDVASAEVASEEVISEDITSEDVVPEEEVLEEADSEEILDGDETSEETPKLMELPGGHFVINKNGDKDWNIGESCEFSEPLATIFEDAGAGIINSSFEGDVQFRFISMYLQPSYILGEYFEVKANGTLITPNAEGKYTVHLKGGVDTEIVVTTKTYPQVTFNEGIGYSQFSFVDNGTVRDDGSGLVYIVKSGDIVFTFTPNLGQELDSISAKVGDNDLGKLTADTDGKYTITVTDIESPVAIYITEREHKLLNVYVDSQKVENMGDLDFSGSDVVLDVFWHLNGTGKLFVKYPNEVKKVESITYMFEGDAEEKEYDPSTGISVESIDKNLNVYIKTASYKVYLFVDGSPVSGLDGLTFLDDDVIGPDGSIKKFGEEIRFKYAYNGPRNAKANITVKYGSSREEHTYTKAGDVFKIDGSINNKNDFYIYAELVQPHISYDATGGTAGRGTADFIQGVDDVTGYITGEDIVFTYTLPEGEENLLRSVTYEVDDLGLGAIEIYPNSDGKYTIPFEPEYKGSPISILFTMGGRFKDVPMNFDTNLGTKYSVEINYRGGLEVFEPPLKFNEEPGREVKLLVTAKEGYEVLGIDVDGAEYRAIYDDNRYPNNLYALDLGTISKSSINIKVYTLDKSSGSVVVTIAYDADTLASPVLKDAGNGTVAYTCYTMKEDNKTRVDSYILTKDSDYTLSTLKMKSGVLANVEDLTMKTQYGSPVSILADYTAQSKKYKFTCTDNTDFAVETKGYAKLVINSFHGESTVEAKNPESGKSEVLIPQSKAPDTYVIPEGWTNIKVESMPEAGYILEKALLDGKPVGEYKYYSNRNAGLYQEFNSLENRNHTYEVKCSADMLLPVITTFDSREITDRIVDSDTEYKIMDMTVDSEYAQIESAAIVCGKKRCTLEVAGTKTWAKLTPADLAAVSASAGSAVTVEVASNVTIAKDNKPHSFKIYVGGTINSVKSVVDKKTGKKITAISQGVGSLATYNVTYDAVKTGDEIIIRPKDGSTGFIVNYDPANMGSFSIYIHKVAFGEVSGAVEIVNVTDAGHPQVIMTLPVNGKAPDWASKAPTAKVIYSSDNYFTLELGLPNGVEANADLYYMVTPILKSEVPAGVTMDLSPKFIDSERTEEAIFVMTGDGAAAKFDLDIKLVQKYDDTRTIAEAQFYASAAKVLKNQSTKNKYVTEKISLKKVNTKVYVGQSKVKVATVDFGKNSTCVDQNYWEIDTIYNPNDDRIILYDAVTAECGISPYDNGIYVTVKAKNQDVTGKYTLIVRTKDNASQATMTIDVVNTIGCIVGDSEVELAYKQVGKAGTFTPSFIVYDSSNTSIAYAQIIKNAKLKCSVGTPIYSGATIVGVKPVEGLTVSDKGVVKIAKDFEVDETIEYAVYIEPAETKGFESLYLSRNGSVKFRITERSTNAKYLEIYTRDDSGTYTLLNNKSVLPCDKVNEVYFVVKDKDKNPLIGNTANPVNFSTYVPSPTNPIKVVSDASSGTKVTYTACGTDNKKAIFTCKLGVCSNSDNYTKWFIRRSPYNIPVYEGTGDDTIVNTGSGYSYQVPLGATPDSEFYVGMVNSSMSEPSYKIDGTFKIVSGAKLVKKDSLNRGITITLTAPEAKILFTRGSGSTKFEKTLTIKACPNGGLKAPKVKNVKIGGENIYRDYYYYPEDDLYLRIDLQRSIGVESLGIDPYDVKIEFSHVAFNEGYMFDNLHLYIDEKGNNYIAGKVRYILLNDNFTEKIIFYIEKGDGHGGTYKYYLTNDAAKFSVKLSKYNRKFSLKAKPKMTILGGNYYPMPLEYTGTGIKSVEIKGIYNSVIKGKYTDFVDIFKVSDDGKSIVVRTDPGYGEDKLRAEMQLNPNKKVPDAREGIIKVLVVYKDSSVGEYYYLKYNISFEKR